MDDYEMLEDYFKLKHVYFKCSVSVLALCVDCEQEILESCVPKDSLIAASM